MSPAVLRHLLWALVGFAIACAYVAALVSTDFHASAVSERKTLLLALPFLVVGLLIGRWWTPALPALVWVAYYEGLRTGYWGSGVGDGWESNRDDHLVAGVAMAAASVIVRWGLNLIARRMRPASRSIA